MELFPSKIQSTKRPLEDSDETDQQAAKRPHLATRRTNPATSYVRRAYQRHPKPPYSYLSMMTVAIQSSPIKRLTLAQIQDALQDMFPFFRGEYTGWRDSVRHFLSSSPCFIKISRNHKTKASKGNHWTVDLSLVPADAFRRLKVKPEMEDKWALTLTQQLQIPDIILPPPRTPPKKMLRLLRDNPDHTSSTLEGSSTLTKAYPTFPDHRLQTAAPSLSYTEAQYTRYLREQTPSDTQVQLSQYPPFASLLFQATTSFDYTYAASNLHRLCPEPEYGSPTPAARDWSSHSVTPTVRQSLKFEIPESQITPTSRCPDDTHEPASLCLPTTNFDSSFVEYQVIQQHTELAYPSNLLPNQHVNELCPAPPTAIQQEQMTSCDQQATSGPSTLSTLSPVTSLNHSEPVQKEETTSDDDIAILSFHDLPLSPDGAYSYI